MQLFPTRSQLLGRLLPEAFAAAAAGGVIGAGARWMVGRQFAFEPGDWPWATLTVNLLGCLLIGVAARRIRPGSLPWDFVVTGVLGGFTTMSALAVELNQMVDAGRTGLALAYLVVTLGGGVFAASLAAARRRAGGMT